eukprot:g9028.t1
MLEASSSARIRSDALNLLRGFLDSAPPATPPSPASGFFFKGPGAPSKVFYPIPSKTSPTGIEVVPDVGPLGEPTPGLDTWRRNLDLTRAGEHEQPWRGERSVIFFENTRWPPPLQPPLH